MIFHTKFLWMAFQQIQKARKKTDVISFSIFMVLGPVSFHYISCLSMWFALGLCTLAIWDFIVPLFYFLIMNICNWINGTVQITMTKINVLLFQNHVISGSHNDKCIGEVFSIYTQHKCSHFLFKILHFHASLFLVICQGALLPRQTK